ncbi:MAG: hypothetical protein ACYSUM_21855 [Planctomycetota bacterium]|jgi:hypothetical protein
MRVLVLLTVALCVACQTPGYTTAGVSWFHPELDRTGELDGGPLVTFGGGLKAGNLPGGRLANPLSESEPDERRGTYLEAFGGYGNNIDEIDVALLGAGARFRMGSQGQWSLRAGAAYANVDSGGNHLVGPYLGVGYDFYLNDDKTLSIAPELMLYGLFDNDDSFVAGSAGISLTYHWGGNKKNNKR